MSCDTQEAGHQHNTAPSVQNPAHTSDVLAAVGASLNVNSEVDDEISSPETIERPFSGDGEQAQCPSRSRSNSCSSIADDQLDSEPISDILPSEVSPANTGEDFGDSMDMILFSATTNTAAIVSDGLQSEHTQTFLPTLFESPWGADSPWGIYKVPEEFDEQGRVTRYTELIVQKVKPYVREGRQGQQGGSGILDTDDPTHYYLMMPLGSLDLPLEVPQEIQEQRRMYSEAAPIPPLGPDEHTGLTDDETSDSGRNGRSGDNSGDSGDDGGDEEEVDAAPENDGYIENPEATAIPTVPMFGVLWRPIGIRDVRESHSSQEVISTNICPDYETGSVMSWTSDECDPEGADVQAQDVSPKSKHKHNTNVDHLHAHCSPPKSFNECDADIEESRAYSFLAGFKDEHRTEVEDMKANNVRSRIFVTTTDGGTVRIDLPRILVVSFPAKPTKELPFSVANLSKTCWDIIKDHGIAGVRVINADKSINDKPDSDAVATQLHLGLSLDDSTSSLPTFDSVWIQANATFAMNDDFPPIGYYLDIQDICDRSIDALAPQYISFLYYNLTNLSAHYLLNKPLAPPNGTLEEQMADGEMIFADESNLTVPQFIKRLYVDAKLQSERNRLHFASQPGLNALMLPISGSPMKEAAAMVDDWPVEEKVVVPRTFDHNTAYFDLQQIDWIDKIGYHPAYVRQRRDNLYIEYRNTSNDVTHVSRTPVHTVCFPILTTVTVVKSNAERGLQPRSLRPESHVHQAQG